jgi:protein-arginine kinase activator protein McsA
MNEFFNNLTDVKKLGFTKSGEELSKELSEKLSKLLKEEKYEEAAILRDYMFNNNIKRIK